MVKIYLKASDNNQSMYVQFLKLCSNLFYSDFIWGCPAGRTYTRQHFTTV